MTHRQRFFGLLLGLTLIVVVDVLAWAGIISFVRSLLA